MKLYLITAEDEDGENFDMVVQAISIERAVELWREQWDFDETVNIDDEPDPVWARDIVYLAPSGANIETAARVWRIDNDPMIEGVVHWGGWTEIAPNPHYPAGRMTLVAHVPYR